MRWDAGTAVMFRFAVLYLGLFSLATQILGSLVLVPGLPFRGFGALWPMRSITTWIGANVLGVETPLDFSPATGETLAFWIQTGWILLAAVLGTLVWTIVAGSRDYTRAHEWFRLLVRVALAGQLLEYGITKVIPNQFEAPSLNVLVTPSGDLSLNTLLWTTIGSSPGYQMITGWAELVAGVLLILPRTVLLGALVALIDMVHVFALNMTFDIGLKLTTFHLILLVLALIAPDLPRIYRFLVRNEPVAPPYRASSWPGTREAATVLIVFGLYLAGMQTWANVRFWNVQGGGAPRSALYGIWDVEEMAVSGIVRPVELNDYDRQWRRMIFDEAGAVAIQRTDDSFARFAAVIDEPAGNLELTRPASPSRAASFEFQRAEPERLLVEGIMDGVGVRAVLRRRNEDTFRLLNSHFRWIRADAD